MKHLYAAGGNIMPDVIRIKHSDVGIVFVNSNSFTVLSSTHVDGPLIR